MTDSSRPSEPDAASEPARLHALEAENARLRGALAESREAAGRLARIRLVADALPVLIAYIDAECRYRFNNRAYEGWFDLDRDAVAGLHMREVLGDEAFERLRPMVDRALAGEQVSVDRELPYRNGTRHVHIDYMPDRADDGSVVGFFVLVEDISERERTARELRESEARFRAIADCTPAPIWVTNEAGIEFANQAFAEVAGRPVDELTGAVWMDIVHPDDLPSVLALRDEAWQSGEPYAYEARFRRADGAMRWMQVSCGPRFDADGALAGYVGMAVDVTEARSAQQALRSSEAQLREDKRTLETLNRIGASIAPELDLQRLVQMVVDAGVELTGAQFGAFFYNVHDDVGESLMLYAIAGVERSEFSKFPMPRNTAIFAPTFDGVGVVRSDDITADPRYGRNEPHRGMPEGHLPVTSYLAVPVVSRSGEAIGGLFFGHAERGRFSRQHEQLIVGIAGHAAVAIDNARLFESAQRELADRRRAEEALRELNQSLEARVAAAIADREQAEAALRQSQKMEAVGQLTGGIAHDFNNLLTIITGNIDAARRSLGDQGPDRIHRALCNAMIGAERAAVLTQRLLAFSRRQPLQPRTVDINKLVTGMSELLHRTLGETIEVETVLAAGLWRVSADTNQLENAILNLAVNARDAMPDGGKLTIETANTHLDREYAAQNPGALAGQYVAICVSDTGIGMNADTLQRVFEPFFTTKDVGKGTGLGLSMVYGFVKQSGGHLKLYSEEGQGTTARIYLPRLIGAADEDEAGFEQPVPEGSREETILVCEDDDDVRAFTVEVLRELGYRVLEAHDGPSALRLLERQEAAVHLLFTDVVLPSGMTGADVAREAVRIRPGLRVLFTTGYARNAIVHHGRLDPGVELITKPFAYADLAARVREILDRI